jgi:hypothetical protein
LFAVGIDTQEVEIHRGGAWMASLGGARLAPAVNEGFGSSGV